MSAGVTPSWSCCPLRAACSGAGGLGELLLAGPRAEAILEGWALWYRAMPEYCSESCSLWEAQVGSAQEGQHPLGGTYKVQRVTEEE